MYWAARTRPQDPSPVRYQLRAREQTAQITPPVVTRYGLTRSQPGMIGRG